MRIVVIGAIVLFVLVHVYRHVSSPFWSKQPVVNAYNPYWWFFTNRVINSGPPLLNRYVRLQEVSVQTPEQLTADEKDAFAKFIRDNYLRSDEASYLPDTGHVFDYLGRTGAMVVRFVRNGKLEGGGTNRIMDAKLPGPVHMHVGYFDNLTVSVSRRKRGVGPTVVQSYLYLARTIDPGALVHFFKREGDVKHSHLPLCKFQANIYEAKHLSNEVGTHYGTLSAKFIGKKDYAELRRFCDREIRDATAAVCMQYSDLFLLIGKGHIKVVVCRYKNTIEHFFFIRNTPTYDKHGIPVLELFALASAPGRKASQYVSLLVACLRKGHQDFCIVVEKTGKLEEFCNCPAMPPLSTCPMAFFLYNYAHRAVPTSKCFILY